MKTIDNFADGGLYDQLVSLSPERFEYVLNKIGVASHEISSRAAPQSTRAQEALEWLMHRAMLDDAIEHTIDAACREAERDGKLRREAAEMFRLLGFEVEGLATPDAPFQVYQRIGTIRVDFLVGFWDSELSVTASAIAEYHATLLSARVKLPRLDGFFVARESYHPKARELAEQYGIQVRMIQELQRDLLPLDSYATRLIEQFERDPLSRHYVPLRVARPHARKSWSASERGGRYRSKPRLDDPMVAAVAEFRAPVLMDLAAAWFDTDERVDPHPSPEEDEDPPSWAPRSGLAISDLAWNLNNWLDATDVPCALVFGDYGTGKTSSFNAFAAEMARRYLAAPDECRCPLVVPLKEFPVGLSEAALVAFLAQELAAPHLSWAVLQSFLERSRLVLLLDGFDEMGFQVDRRLRRLHFTSLVKFADIPGSKVLISGRPGYFPHYEELIELTGAQRPDAAGDGLKEPFHLLELQPLSPAQIESYLLTFAGELAPAVLDKVRTFINTVYNLRDLAERPFLLDLIVKTVPGIDAVTDGITPARLYALYTSRWLDREHAKGEFRWLITKKEKREFMEALAWRMLESDRLKVHFSELASWVQEHFHVASADVVDYLAHDIRTCSFLARDANGNYRFVHRSFMEYFVAMRLYSTAASLGAEAFDDLISSPRTGQITENSISFALDLISVNATNLAGFIKTKIGWYTFAGAVTARIGTYEPKRRAQIVWLLSGFIHSEGSSVRSTGRHPITPPGTKNTVLSCSFCRETQTYVEQLIAGSGVYICNFCVVTAVHQIWSRNIRTRAEDRYVCSFCGKDSQEVNCLVASETGVTICNECLVMSCEILSEQTDGRTWPVVRRSRA